MITAWPSPGRRRLVHQLRRLAPDVPPAHSPLAPPRLGIARRYNNDLSITGQAYAAVTPDTLMDGAALSAMFSVGPAGAHFDFGADFILQVHPLHYQTTVHVSAGLWYGLGIRSIRKKASGSLGTGLELGGPLFAGLVKFDLVVVTIKVAFGALDKHKPKALELGPFVDMHMKNTKKDDANKERPHIEHDDKNKDELHADHILTLESGGVPPATAPTEAHKPDTPWVVRGSALMFTVLSRIPATAIEFSQGTTPARRAILAPPMQLLSNSAGLAAPLTITITRVTSHSEPVMEPGFKFTPITETLRLGHLRFFGEVMLSGAGREATVPHTTGGRIVLAKTGWSDRNPRIAVLAKPLPPLAVAACFWG